MKHLLLLLALSPNLLWAQDCKNCAEKKESPSPVTNNSNIKDLTKLTLKVYCKEPFKKSQWDRISSKKEPNELSEEELYIYLLRFTKPGGFDSTDSLHRRILVKVLEDSTIRENYGNERMFALRQILLSTPRDQDINDYILEFDLKPTDVKDGESCQTAEELKASEELIYQFVYDSVKDYGIENPRCSIPEQVNIFLPTLKKLDKEKQISITNPLYRGLGSCITSETEGSIFISKSLVFAKNAILAKFGHDVPDITDISHHIDNYSGDSHAIVLSNEKILTSNDEEIDNSNNFGGVRIARFYPDENSIVKWKTGGKTFTAKGKGHDIKPSEHIDTSKSPDYKKMWADKKLTGMTMVSPNLGDWKDKVTSNYIAYYVDQGFEFGEPVDVADSHTWIKNAISSGEIDYVLKEAHAGGNDYDLIGLANKHKIMTGKKKKSDGTEEVMHILMPQGEWEETRVSYDDMHNWMDEREKNNKGPLVYLNSSCWSTEQAKNEIMTIKSKLFVDVPSTSKTTTFSNSKNSTKYHIMQGLRESKTYDQMLEGMKTTDRHKHGYNQFLFPSQSAYQNIMSANEGQVKLTFTITDERNRPYALHEALD